MKFDFKIILLATVILSACTAAVHNPAEFEAQATHKEKLYAAPLDELYACMMRKAVVAGQISTWKSDTEAYYGESGFFSTKLTARGSNKTLVRMSSVKAAYIQAFDKWFNEIDKCAGE